MEILIYAIIGFAIGRWLMTILDSLLELFTIYITRIYTKIQLDINMMNKDYQDICNEELISTQAIGYKIPSSKEADDEEEIEDKKIGFK
jgi:hypothetical protein